MTNDQRLSRLGWDEFFENHFRKHSSTGQFPARVIAQHRFSFEVLTGEGQFEAHLRGKLRESGLPGVGDWVVCSRADSHSLTIEALLPRKTGFSRKVAGSESREQVVAANVDTVFLVTSLNQEFSPRRVERYLVEIWQSGARPIILLSKADLCPDPEPFVNQLELAAPAVPWHIVSALKGTGIESLSRYLKPGKTIALVGSSGVGKSTLINILAGENLAATREIRSDDDKGRHVTSRRELYLLAGGSLLLDTPGMRELQLWEADEGLQRTFEEISDLAHQCRFRDCRHESEPGCAVLRALDEGRLEEERYLSYRKLQGELQYQARRRNAYLAREQKRNDRIIHRAARRHIRDKRGGDG